MSSSSSVSPGRCVSVALTTYNGQAHLEAQLNSLACQTLLPAELVVCDDCSTDSSVAVLEAFAGRAPFPVHIHRNPTQLGVVENFHRAFALCSSRFIAYCDQDDVWAPEKLANCYSALRRPRVVLASHRSRLTDSELRPLGIIHPEGLEPGCYAFPHLPLRYWGYGHQMVFSRKLLPVINRLRATASQTDVPLAGIDKIIPIAAGMLGDTVYVAEDLVDFRRHGNSVTWAVSDRQHATQTKSSLDSRLASKRFDLVKQRDLISALRQWVIANPGSSNEAGHWAKYTAHLDHTLRAVNARLALHEGGHRSFRARAFTAALASRAYRDPRRGGAGRNQFLVDLLTVLKPSRE
jgi:glycosyltransferase involved in cell wall biosynthesis